MLDKKKILLITEGKKGEVNLFNKLFEEYELSMDREIFCYKTNIYELYGRMFQGNEDELDSMDLIDVLKQKEPQNQVLKEKYTDIILVFDYDPQDALFAKEKIELMQNYFSESTNNGKLYINYPMLEAYKHFKSYPDKEYKDRKTSLEELKNGKYKQIVDKEAKITGIRSFNKEIFNEVIKQNIQKENYLLGNEYEEKDLKNTYFNISQNEILKIQNKELCEKQELYVLSTCLFFICDYKFDLIL